MLLTKEKELNLSIRKKRSVFLCLFLALTASPLLQAQISPGAVQPQIDFTIRPNNKDKDIVDVPAVIDRPLGMEEGPSINVSNFQLNFRLGSSTPKEKSQLLKDATKALEEARLAKQGNFTIGQLQEAANQVTRIYRLGGYILAQAYIPQQEVNNGVVTVEVIIGTIGKISADTQSLYSEKTIIKAFSERSGTELQQQVVEGALLRVDDLPGLEAFGVFKPGKNVGEADLVIKVKEESAVDYFVFADNHGAESTGRERVLGNILFNNLTGNGDQLSLVALQSINPSDSLYGAISYQIPITARSTLGASFSTNEYDAQNNLDEIFEILEISGDTKIASIFMNFSMIRSRTFNFYNYIELSKKYAELESTVLPLEGEDNLTTVKYKLGFDSRDSLLGGGLNRGSIALDIGLDDFLGSMDSDGDGNSIRFPSDSGDLAGGDFTKIFIDFSRSQAISRNNSLLFRFQGQYSDDLLTSLEQFSIGGPNSVRAYPVSEYIRDRAIFSSLEWIINAPGFANAQAFADRTWGEMLHVSFFVDYAKGRLNDVDSSTVELSGAGVGLEFSLENTFFIRVDAASPLGDEDASNGDDPQYWLSAGYQF
jgi:hemolysin activation/secretion protein